MKNIAIIVHSLNGGGAERIGGLLSKYLSTKYNVYLFLESVDDIIYDYGGTIINIGQSRPFFEYAIKKYKEKYKIDVAISFLEDMNFANIRTKGREKVIVSERCVQSLIRPFRHDEELKIKKYYNHADKIVACAEGVKFDLEKNYGIKKEKIVTIYNFIDKETIQQKSEKGLVADAENFIGDSEFFVNIGRLSPQKNQQQLIIDFCNYIKTTNSNEKLIIIGSGKLKVDLENLIKDLSMDNNILIMDYTDNPFPYIRKAKGLIVYSNYEGLPNVILEAMSIGSVIVSTDCLSGPRELLDDEVNYDKPIKEIQFGKRGILLPIEKTEKVLGAINLRNALVSINEDKNLCKKMKNEQQKYMESYENNKILEKWIDVIESERNTSLEMKDSECSLDEAKKKYIYGAGYVGTTIYERFKKKYSFSGFVVTKKNGKNEYLGIPLLEIDEIKDNREDVVFFIGVSDVFQNEVINEIEKRKFYNLYFPFIEPCAYDYYIDKKDLNLKEEIEAWYATRVGEEIDIDNPVTFNEKIQWLKVYDNKPIKQVLSDKIGVRDFVKDRIGDQYLVPQLGVWERYEQIDFEKLPNSFVLKCNTGSGGNILVKDKNTLNHKKNKEQFEQWQNLKYEYKSGLEMQYAGVKSKILAEKMLVADDGKDLKDYKLFVFNGKVRLIQVDIDRQHEHKRNLYTPDWVYLPYSILYPTAPEIQIEKPKQLEKMIELAEILGKEFIHVRVDFYISEGKIYFGEMTFSHGSGVEEFTPKEFGVELGSWMILKG